MRLAPSHVAQQSKFCELCAVHADTGSLFTDQSKSCKQEMLKIQQDMCWVISPTQEIPVTVTCSMTDLISDANKEAVYAVILVVNQQLSKDGRPFGMHRAVGNPVLLSYSGGCIDDELVSLLVKGGSCLHLYCIVSCGINRESVWPKSQAPKARPCTPKPCAVVQQLLGLVLLVYAVGLV